MPPPCLGVESSQETGKRFMSMFTDPRRLNLLAVFFRLYFRD